MDFMCLSNRFNVEGVALLSTQMSEDELEGGTSIFIYPRVTTVRVYSFELAFVSCSLKSEDKLSLLRNLCSISR